MSKSSECRKCHEPLVQTLDGQFVCVECPRDPSDEIDEAEYTYSEDHGLYDCCG